MCPVVNVSGAQPSVLWETALADISSRLFFTSVTCYAAHSEGLCLEFQLRLDDIAAIEAGSMLCAARCGHANDAGMGRQARSDEDRDREGRSRYVQVLMQMLRLLQSSTTRGRCDPHIHIYL